MALLQFLAGILTGKAGEQIGGAVSFAAQATAIAGIVGAGVVWLSKNGESTAVTVTWNDLAFWGTILGLFVFVVTRLVHRAPPPG